MAGSERRGSLRDLLRIIFRRWRLFVLGAALFAVGALILWHFVPVEYTGVAIFERRMDPAAVEFSRGKGDAFTTLKQTQEHEVKGYGAVAQAVEELGMTRGMPRTPDGQYTGPGQMAKQELVRGLMANITVEWKAKSEQVDLVSVSFTHRDPLYAERLPNTLVKNYIERASSMINSRLKASQDFLAKQVATCSERLTELSRQRIRFETQHAGTMPESPGALQKNINDLVADIDTRQLQLNLAKQKLARLRALATGAPEPTTQPTQVIRGPNPELKRLEQQLRESKDELEIALTMRHMTEKHPTVRALRAKIANLQERITQTPSDAVLQEVYGGVRVVGNLAMELAASQSEVEITANELQRLQRRLTTYQGLMANFEPIRQEYMQIQKKIEDQQAELKRWEDRLAQVRMDLAAEVAKKRTHHETVEAAQRQFRPSFPTLWMVMGFAIVGGLGFASGLVFLSNSLDRAVTTIEDASDRFGLPIHGVIGEIVTPRERVMRTLKRWTIGPVVTLILLATLSLSGLSAVLWLRYPQEFSKWKSSPAGFLNRHVVQPCSQLMGLKGGT